MTGGYSLGAWLLEMLVKNVISLLVSIIDYGIRVIWCSVNIDNLVVKFL